MKLSAFVEGAKVPVGQFAVQLGVSRQTLHLYLTDQRFPRPDVLRRIHAATGGQVTANDFLDAPADAPSRTAEQREAV